VRGTGALLHILGCCATLALWAPAAHSGTYDVWGCRFADGSPAPEAGWEPFQPEFGRTWNVCSSLGGSLGAALNESAAVPPDAKIGWVFTAPAGLTIENYTVYRYARSSGDLQRSREYWLYNDAPVFDNQYRFPQETCSIYVNCPERGTPGDPQSPANRFEERDRALKQLYLITQCRAPDPAGCPPGSPGSYFALYAARLGLSDISPPTFRSAPSGSLMIPGAVLSGERTVRFEANDVGGGLARAGIVVDGQLRPEQLVDVTGTTCRLPYTAPVPCPLSAGGLLSLDTAELPNGPHRIQLALTDAGENRTLSDPVTITTQNGGRPNGIGASRFVKLSAWANARRGEHSTSRTVAYGRTASIHGRLVAADGTPIREALIDVSAVSRHQGGRVRRLAPLQTDQRGRFAFRPRPGSSRTFTMQYRAFTLDDVPVASERVHLHVRAGVTLQVRPRRASPHGRIAFTGRLLGGPGRRGTQVQLFAVARRGRDRVPVATVRADRRGRFHFSYRFRRTFAPFTYYFQAVVERQNSYPYATGRSERVSVRIVR
jgi:hypothetical protein